MPSLSEMFTTFVDKQSIERLEECVALEEAFTECERLQKTLPNPTAGNDYSRSRRIRLEDTRVGMKISRFYGWGLTNPKAQVVISQMREDATFGSLGYNPSSPSPSPTSSSTNNDHMVPNDTHASRRTEMKAPKATSQENVFIQPCSMERHAIWACRALALQCAPDLVQLKDCFQKNGNNNPSEDGYNHLPDDHSKEKFRNTCMFEMNKVAKCVNQHKMELDERLSVEK